MNVTTQNNRLLSIDLARGLAVFFMIAVHTLEVFASEEVKNSVFGQIIEFFGGPPAAPVFMTLMGFSFMYSRKSELKPRLLRGFKIFLSGYILNIIRGVIPFTLSTQLEMDIAKTFPLEKINEYTILTIVDILQFAGIALMIMALIQEFKIHKYIIDIFMEQILKILNKYNDPKIIEKIKLLDIKSFESSTKFLIYNILEK
jgi:surface polysaccharide O-acyltransferase-like enzyme